MIRHRVFSDTSVAPVYRRVKRVVANSRSVLVYVLYQVSFP